MSDPEDHEDDQPEAPRPKRRWPWVVGFVVLVLGTWGWFSREDIAANLIGSELAKRGLSARYEIVRIGPARQVFRNISIGDPANPDLSVERIEVETTNSWGLPGIGRITLVRPRLYGRWMDGKLTFGALDPLIYTKSKEPPQLPALDIALVDARARVASPWGVVGFKAEGAGNLADGFNGILAAVAPEVNGAGCSARGATLFAKVNVASGRPGLAGPLRLGPIRCANGLELAGGVLALGTRLDRHFDGAEGRFDLSGDALKANVLHIASTQGKGRFVWRKGVLTGHAEAEARGVETPQVRLATLALDGTLRAAGGLASVDLQGDLKGRGLALGRDMDAALASVQRSGEGTLAASLVARARAGIARELPGGSMAANFVARRSAGAWSLVVPQAGLSGRSGTSLFSASRIQLAAGGLAGNFLTGGADLPRLSGRMERGASGQIVARFAMPEYRAGDASIAIPRLMLAQADGGAIGLAGEARLSGLLAGGAVRDLVLPLEGNWSTRTGLALWRRCTAIGFRSLELAGLALSQDRLTLCPGTGGAIVRAGPAGTRIAAGAPSLDLAGSIGDSPVRMKSGAIGFSWPGTLVARRIDVELGARENPSRFALENVTARLGSDVAGSFAGASLLLSAVPLDVMEATGNWRFSAGKLAVSGASFRLKDRQADARFQPLIARDATLELADNRITANAILREPASGREVLRAALFHDLGHAAGHADLAVDGLKFDRALQPDTISRLALGVIANARGAVRGNGRVDWTPDKITSHGTASSDGIDFAAAFGPVKGVSGTVEFTDLLGLVTAPHQKLQIASINPGIEAAGGWLDFELRGNNVLAVNGAEWPFLDGTLRLEPTRMVLGAAEVRRYTLTIDGLDAAKLVNQLEMGNISATGTFDGTLPLVFDENGGRIEGGALVSRGGGNLSYLGALTYRDLSPIANFAFDALRSLDYRGMRVELEGELAGEIITRLKFDGVTQGKGARRNFLTQQVAKLPVRFNVNVRAPFFRLVSSFRSLYDPDFVTDPRLLGLIGKDGKPINPKQPNVQPPASGEGP